MSEPFYFEYCNPWYKLKYLIRDLYLLRSKYFTALRLFTMPRRLLSVSDFIVIIGVDTVL